MSNAAISLHLPRKVSAMKPPRRQRMNEVPRKLVTVFAATALPRFTAIPSDVNRSFSSTTAVVHL
ncbi:unnamed protein product [Spirodela intermedia]|uniref:Uncharacterized protein n=2 Tax=Spirodela intermedia TaxID=51605 RepID=A0A7I8K3E8_SPIIN|nr:unnamed protein product [Spirodela intermedia]CAA6656184.1 unnamed protein product [Spirodela intermedia]CAA7391657.1 unnamed protein product [Spirodela intermedia]